MLAVIVAEALVIVGLVASLVVARRMWTEEHTRLVEAVYWALRSQGISGYEDHHAIQDVRNNLGCGYLAAESIVLEIMLSEQDLPRPVITKTDIGPLC